MAVCLTVLLAILKILGLLLLALVGLILLILGILLFVPVRYRLIGEFDEKKGGEAQISWLGPAVKITGGYYYKGSELFYQGKVLGLLMVTNGDEKTFPDKISDWKDARAKKKRLKEQAKRDKAREKERRKEKKEEKPVSTTTTPNINTITPQTSETAKPDFSSYADYEQKAETKRDDNFTGTYTPFQYFEEEVPREKLSEKINRIIEKIKTTLEGIRNKSEEVNEKIEDVVDKFEEVERFYYENESQYAMQKMLKLIKRTILYVLPTGGDGEIYFGFCDPSITGRLYGICCALGLAGAKWVNLYPNFQEAEFHGKLSVKGRLRLFYFVRTGLVIILDKKLRNVYKKGKKVIGHE